MYFCCFSPLTLCFAVICQFHKHRALFDVFVKLPDEIEEKKTTDRDVINF